ncbi:DHS-like NAD/FAD-binding domain-containing protein [Mycena alexandri]|uniref:DHS-like NAD/FAD-binding domain-containing protein n=1 Tax=Mycena alexandri TaxID=1745969 RepID=A0AAD6T7S1_9AGAR|nr:DHS-like NAD/FAD-binding domain-containing protein [Mycena alexandri]
MSLRVEICAEDTSADPAILNTLGYKNTINAIVSARKIIVVCGAGISTHAGIPCFSDETKPTDGQKGSRRRNRDLFDAALLREPEMMSEFLKCIGNLHVLAQKAAPTPFHRVLQLLDDRTQLLRVYTPNVDGLEEKGGLTIGIPAVNKFSKQRYAKGIQLPPATEIPRCIPLHGSCRKLHCPICHHVYNMDANIHFILGGTLPICTKCSDRSASRVQSGKHPLGIPTLRPSITLYSEEHEQGEIISEIVGGDLREVSAPSQSKGTVILLVAGTRLGVAGTKSLVKEMAKAVKARNGTHARDNKK